jgi:hypothetical protein
MVFFEGSETLGESDVASVLSPYTTLEAGNLYRDVILGPGLTLSFSSPNSLVTILA